MLIKIPETITTTNMIKLYFANLIKIIIIVLVVGCTVRAL